MPTGIIDRVRQAADSNRVSNSSGTAYLAAACLMLRKDA